MSFKNWFNGMQNAAGLMGSSGLQTTTTQSYPTSWTTTAPSQYAIPYPEPPTEREITLPVFDVRDRKGIFLRDKEGKLHYHPIEKIASALGYEW